MNTQETIRELPTSPEAERLVLGSVCVGASISEIASAVSADDFSLESNRRIFSAMLALRDAGTGIDRVTLSEELRRRGWLESVGGLSAVVSLDTGMPSLPNIEGYLRIVKDKSTLRRTITACTAMIERCFNQADRPADVLSDASRMLANISADTGADGSLLTPLEVIENYPGGANEFLQPHLSDPGIPTPWSDVNDKIVGLKKQDLVILAARPSVGKTAAAMQIAFHAAKSGKRVAFFSLEMSSVALLQRLVCSVADVDFEAFRKGRTDETQREALMRARQVIVELDGLLLYDKSHRTTGAIDSALRKLKVPVHLVVVDYLQRMRVAGRSENRNQEISQISGELKAQAKEFNAPFLVLSQLTRASTMDGGRRPELSDLRDSGAIEQDADTVAFLHRADNSKAARAQPLVHIEWIVEKQRQGPCGPADLWYRQSRLRFENFTKKQEPD